MTNYLTHCKCFVLYYWKLNVEYPLFIKVYDTKTKLKIPYIDLHSINSYFDGITDVCSCKVDKLIEKTGIIHYQVNCLN